MTTVADLTALPTGTVTFLFTDLEGSTALLQAHPATYRDAVRRHHALLRGAVEGHGGAVFETVGDAVYAAFAAPTEAVAAALAGQRALQSEDWGAVGALRARMGVHTGEVERQGGHYFGAPLYRCARLTATAHGGQVVLSEAAAVLVRDALPEGAGLRALGEHRLKDLAAPERVFQLVHPDLPGEFPALRTLDVLPNNLPAQLTSFVGRERELADVAALLRAQRLVTLAGPGGVGKTRLALQAAADALDGYPDGVWLAGLAALADPTLVPQAVAQAVGVREESGRPLVAALTDALRPKRLLLVLDNCEHVLDASARLADTLLRACPHLKILATSREPLGIAGETAWRVPSLALPDAHLPPSGEALAPCEAVRLFLDRARAVQPAFAVTPQNAPAVVQVCARLDGIPLALELAAARVRVLPVEQLLGRLEDRFRLLTGGSRTALERHQTLQAAVDWSYDLLSDQEQALFDRLSVFAGGFTLEAAEQVGGGAGLDDRDVLDLLTRLVDKSLVVVEEQPDGTARYRLLETLRQYGQQKLAARGEADAIRDQHLAHYLALAEQAEPELRGAARPVWLRRLAAEHDNLRAALAWGPAGRAPGAADAPGRLAGALVWYWFFSDHVTEARGWLGQADAAPSARTAARAKALWGTGLMALIQGDYAAARAALEASVALAREVGAGDGLAVALRELGLVALYQGEPAAARRHGEESVALLRAARTAPGRWDLALALHNLGHAVNAQGEAAAARALFEEAGALFGALGDAWGRSAALGGQALVAAQRGDDATARALLEEVLALRRRAGVDKWEIAEALNLLGEVVQRQGEHDLAAKLYAECLALDHEVGDRGRLGLVVHHLGEVARGRGHAGRAARLFGAAAALREAAGGGTVLSLVGPTDFERDVAAARAVLGDPAFAAAWAEGQALTLEQAVADALEEAQDDA